MGGYAGLCGFFHIFNSKKMDFTKQKILDRNGIDFYAFEYEYEYPAKNLLVAMEEYAEQEAKSFALWLSNQEIGGRNISKLWVDFRAEIGPVVSA